MHRYQSTKKPANPPFKPPSRAQSTGSPISVPATHGSSQHERTDASSARSAWPSGNGAPGPSNNRGGYQTYNRTNSSSYGGRQQDGGWGRGSGSESFGYGPSSNKVVTMHDDFADSVEANTKDHIKELREKARQRDAPKPLSSPGKVKAEAEAKDRSDNFHSREHAVQQRRIEEHKRRQEQKEKNKLKEGADAARALANKRISADAQSGIVALPSFKRTSTSSSTLPRKPATYSREDRKREQVASAAEERRRKERKERGETDEIEDADEDSDDIEVVQNPIVRKDSKGKGKQPNFYVDVPSSPGKSKNGRSPRKSLPAVDIATLMLPNKPVSKSSSGRVSSPVRSSQSKVIDLADSPEKPRRSKPPPPAPEKSPSPPTFDLNAVIEQERAEEEAKAKKEEAKAEKRREREKQRIVLSADEEEDDDGEDSEEAVRREWMVGSPRGRYSKTPDPLLWAEEIRADPSTLCPFCSRTLPTIRSSALSELLEYLLARPDIVDFPTARNPAGKRLPVVQTASFCRLHEEERVVIPNGIAQGWPTEIDWEGLPKRIDRQLPQHLSDIITGRTPSLFFEDAKREWEAKGNKMKNLLSEYSSFDVEQPGYYGSRGHEVIVATITRLFVIQTPLLAPFRCTPLDPAAYIRRVLVPETAVQLIKADLSLPDDESARTVLRESRAFGKALWHGGLEGKEAERKFIKEEERRERREEEEEEESQEKEKKAGGKDKGKGKGKEKEKVVVTEAEREKEKRREQRKKEKEIIRRAEVIAKGLSVTNESDEEAGGGKVDRTTARRKPKVGNSAPPPPAAPPAKRKPKQQLNSERVAGSASGSVNTSNGGGRASESDSDDMEVTTVKKRKAQPPKSKPPPPKVKRKPGASSTSLSKPRSAAPSSSPSSSDDEPLPRVKAKTKLKPTTKSTSKPSSRASSSSKSPAKPKPSSKSSKRASLAVDSDSDPFEAEIETSFKKKGKSAAAPWESKRGKRKGAGKGASEDDSPPPDSDESSSDDDMDVD